MLEIPVLTDQRIIDCLAAEYGLAVVSVEFLPLGADINTAVYRIAADNGERYFLKLRRGDFSPASVEIPDFVHHHGMTHVIPSIPTRRGALSASLPPYAVILYPFIAGVNGFEKSLTDCQWIEFGAALKQFHLTEFPGALTAAIPREQFSPHSRSQARLFLKHAAKKSYADPIAAETADFLRSKSMQIRGLVVLAERLALKLKASSLKFILCHGDIHAWNLLITPEDDFYIVDWDTLILAPKERDLMFIGCGLGGSCFTPLEEETFFYQGYGATDLDPVGMAYYRFERIVEDIAAFSEQIFGSDEGGEDKRQALEYLKSNFKTGGAIELAYQSSGRIDQ